LAEALGALRNPSTGRSAVREVIITERDLPGPRREQLPDLIVCWSDDAEIAALESEAVGTISGPSPDGRTGTHKPPGFVLTRCSRGHGIDIPQNASVLDFAPTLLANFGVASPNTMDGRAWLME
jgi:predicted AlkP superfamily phosphohydrolase/phosphomutase